MQINCTIHAVDIDGKMGCRGAKFMSYADNAERHNAALMCE